MFVVPRAVMLEMSVPSRSVLFSVLRPLAVARPWKKRSVPPTSRLLITIPGTTRDIDQISVRLGMRASVSRLMTVCCSALVVSSRGDSPVTVSVSSSTPISRRRSARAAASATTTMFSC